MASRQSPIVFVVVVVLSCWCCDVSCEGAIGRLLNRPVRQVTEAEKQDMFEKLVRQGSRLRMSAMVRDATVASSSAAPHVFTEDSAVTVETTPSSVTELTEDALQRQGEQLHQSPPLPDDTSVANPKKGPKRKHDRRHAGKKENNKNRRQHRQG